MINHYTVLYVLVMKLIGYFVVCAFGDRVKTRIFYLASSSDLRPCVHVRVLVRFP